MSAPRDDSSRNGTDGPAKADDEVLFDAVIWPHRSLGPRGFAILMAVIGGLSFVAGIAFISAGAWPVFGFLGLDVAAIYLAFRLNYRRGRAVEHVVLTRDALTIRRVDHRGRVQESTIQPYWLSVEVAGRDQADEIRLRSHGRIHTVGGWLSPPERETLAEALRDALGNLRAAPKAPGADNS